MIGPRTSRLHLRTLLLAGATLSCAATLAFAQPVLAQPAQTFPYGTAVPGASQANTTRTAPAVTIRAQRTVEHQVVGHDYAGVPVEQLALTRYVGYRDLNLATPEGEHQLEQRIRVTATQACMQLTGLYPANVWTTSEQACVQTATKRAMAQVPSAVAAAEHHRQGQLR